MTSNTRLRTSIVMIILSAMYAIVLAKDPPIASAAAVGYIAVILTGCLLTNVWKKP